MEVTKYCSIDEKRFSTCSLPLSAFTVLKPGLGTVCSALEHTEKALNGCEKQDSTPEVMNTTSNDDQSPTDHQGSARKRVHASKSCDFQPKSVDQNTPKVVRPDNSDSATKDQIDDLVSGICFRPRFRTLDWTDTERLGNGVDRAGRKLSAKETKKPVSDIVIHEKGDLNSCTIDFGPTRIHPDPCIQDHKSVGNLTESRVDFQLSTGIQQTEESEAIAAPKNWRKRLSSKWKRHSQKTSTHKNSNCSNCPSPTAGSCSSNGVRRSVTTKPVPRRCPSVERLDHSSQPRKRTRTEVPATYRRRRTGADWLVSPSSSPQLEQSTNGCATGVRNESEILHEKNKREETGGEDKECEEKERKEKKRMEQRREESRRPNETLNALVWATAVPAARQLMSPNVIDRRFSRLGRFMSDPCESNPAPNRADSTQRSCTLDRTDSPSASERGEVVKWDC